MNSQVHSAGRTQGNEASSPAAIAALCFRGAETYKKRRAFEYYREGRLYGELNYEEMANHARRLAALLSSLGVRKGGKILLIADNSAFWPVYYFGACIAGAQPLTVSPETARREQNTLRYEGISAILLSASGEGAIPALKPDIPGIFVDRIRWEEKGDAPVSFHGIEKRVSFPALSESIAKGSAGPVVKKTSPIPVKLYRRDRFLSTVSLSSVEGIEFSLVSPVLHGSLVTVLDETSSAESLLGACQHLYPTVIVTDGEKLEKLFRKKVKPWLEKPFFRSGIARFFALRFAGRRFIKSLGAWIRILCIQEKQNISAEASLSPEAESFIKSLSLHVCTIGIGLHAPGTVHGLSWKE
ncbi:MAG: long-chain fatty acid--CoA ligase [Treponema sp.]|nr:long-chain fatty acid--CoA ligase [Treponema sp.]